MKAFAFALILCAAPLAASADARPCSASSHKASCSSEIRSAAAEERLGILGAEDSSYRYNRLRRCFPLKDEGARRQCVDRVKAAASPAAPQRG